ncbi:uncharacterized protein LOC124183903 isoform X3 [Neodiprion fabricii]|uniref:uncharacterized protein LOC124183903 isoform X3 n=1 Tax=Neodiprion fabricii TaxID=2872261 RepID=UPI001ED8F70F|nr:uncharacterized protein LOC124183903 isoform X3 [Neodiprion fabricii]
MTDVNPSLGFRNSSDKKKSQEEKKAARLIHEKMMKYDLLQPRDMLIKLSPSLNFMPSSIFVKRCFPIDRNSGSLIVQTANVTRKILVKRMVSQKWVFYNVNVVEHIKCGYAHLNSSRNRAK